METPSWHSSQGMRVKRVSKSSRRVAVGPSTPVPSWNAFSNQLNDSIAFAAATAADVSVQTAAAAGVRSTTISARKLAASLWELQDLPAPGISVGTTQYPPSSGEEETSDTASPISQADLSYSSPRSAMFSNHQFSKQMSSESRRKNSHGGRQVTAMRTTQAHKLLDKSVDPWVNSDVSILREGQRQHGKLISERKGDVKAGKKFTSVTTMSDLLKVLSRIRILEEQHNSTLSTASALRMQLDNANARVQELELAQDAAHEEIEALMKKLAKVKSSWRTEQNKFKSAVQALKEEVEDEQKARSQIEVANGKMTKELMDAKMAVTNMVEELARERKARELMEDVCDELAREIAEDKAEVEDLKQDSIKMHEELEEERRMLQLAEVWREERVQMKLSEAKLSLEEKGAALDVLCSELQTFLWAGRCWNRADCVQEAEVLYNVVTAIHPRGIIASYPPADIKQEPLLENDLYGLDLSYEKQADCQYGHTQESILDPPKGHSQQNIFYPPNWDNRWPDDSGLREGAQPYMPLMYPVHETQRTFGQLQAEERKNNVCEYKQVSRSQVSGYKDYMEGIADEENFLEVNNDDALYHHQKEDLDRVVCEASEDEIDQGVEVGGGMRHGDVPCMSHGMEDIHITHLQEDNHGQVEALDEVILHGQTQQVDWELVPQQSSWISCSNPHIERGLKGHVLWPKGLMDVVLKENKFEVPI